jgi:hypothetical protein
VTLLHVTPSNEHQTGRVAGVLVADHEVGVVLHTVLPLERPEGSDCFTLSGWLLSEDQVYQQYVECEVPVNVCSLARSLAMSLHARPSSSIVVDASQVANVAESPSSIANEETIFSVCHRSLYDIDF